MADPNVEKGASEPLRQFGYAAGSAALRDAADDLEGRLGTKGHPRNLYEFRAWLRARADDLDTRVMRPGCTANTLGASGGKCPSADPCPVHLCGGGVSRCYCTTRPGESM